MKSLSSVLKLMITTGRQGKVSRTSLLVCFVFVTLLAGCASNDEEVLRPAELVKFEPTVKLKKLWTRKIGSGQDKRYTTFMPVIQQEKIYAADRKGRVFALEQSTGKRLWKQSLKVDVSAAVGVFSNRVMLGTYNADVIVLDANSGEELWRAKASSEISAPPQSNGDIVVAQTIDGRLFAFDAETGERRWTYDHTVPVLTLRGSAAPQLTSNQVITGFGNGQLVSLSSADGLQQWSQRIAQPKGRTELERVVDIDSSPLLVGSFVYGASYQGRIAALSRGSGRILWQQDISTFQNLAAHGNLVFVSTEDDKVIAFDGRSGIVRWENAQLIRRDINAPAVFDDHVAVIDDDGYLHILSLTDGAFAARKKPPGSGFRSPLVSDGKTLYILSNNGKLSAYQLMDIQG